MAYASDLSYNREAFRRQFRLSLFLVAAMVGAAFVLGFALPISGHATAQTAMQDSGFQGRLLNIDE
jgi:uncharacterized membrane protein